MIPLFQTARVECLRPLCRVPRSASMKSENGTLSGENHSGQKFFSPIPLNRQHAFPHAVRLIADPLRHLAGSKGAFDPRDPVDRRWYYLTPTLRSVLS